MLFLLLLLEGLFCSFLSYCVVADIAVVLPDVSEYLMEAVDVLFDVDIVLVFAFVVLFYVFGTVSDVAGLHLVGGGGVSADAAGVLVDVVT